MSPTPPGTTKAPQGCPKNTGHGRRLAMTAGALAATGALLAACSSPPGSQFVGTWTCPGTADQTGSFQITAADNGTYALVRGNDTTALPATYNETIDELTVTTNNGTWIARIDPTSGELTTIDDPNWGIDAAIDRLATTDTTTYVSGELVRLLNTSKVVADPTNPYDENVPIEQVRQTAADTDATSQSEAVSAGAIVWSTRAEVTRTDTGGILSSSSATYAFDPINSELIDCCGAALGNDAAIEFSGVMPLKFPFNSPERDVQVWSDPLAEPVTATFEGKVEDYGLELHKYRVSVSEKQLPAAPLQVPAELVEEIVAATAPQLLAAIPASGNVQLFDFYSAELEYLVEPTTGQIVQAKSSDRVALRLDGGTDDILTKVETEAATADPERVAADVKTSADLIKGLDLPPCDQNYRRQ